MKSVGDIVRTDPVWVNPSHHVGSAILLMRGHNVCGLPVMEGISLVGMLHYENLIGVDIHRRVSDVMWYQVVYLSSALPLREAADIMVRENMTSLPVLGEQGELLGMVNSLELLKELRRSLDPLTELPWADSLREWAITTLCAGHEITILFVDINDFGQFNKRFGHVVGDAVLCAVAGVLHDTINPEREFLCRYGGDEFCIASLRGAEEAQLLAHALKHALHGIALPEMQNESIHVCIGVRGGKRTQEREHIHFAATLNNLINLASRDCIAQKAALLSPRVNGRDENGQHEPRQNFLEEDPSSWNFAEKPLAEVRESPQSHTRSGAMRESDGHPSVDNALASPVQRVHLNRLEVTWDGPVAHVSVEIACYRHCGTGNGTGNGGSYHGSAQNGLETSVADGQMVGSLMSREIERDELPTLVAEATLAALRRILPEQTTVCLEEVVSARTAGSRELMTLLAQATTASGRRSLTGTAMLGEDAPQAIAAAVLSMCSPLLVEACSHTRGG